MRTTFLESFDIRGKVGTPRGCFEDVKSVTNAFATVSKKKYLFRPG